MGEENGVAESAANDKTADDKTAKRGVWGNHCDYFLSSLGLAVGLGNIWRFPYVCYQNGGGTFLVPYLLMLILIGIPLFFMEMVMGQYAGLSVTKIFMRISPGLGGMGYGIVMVPILICFYYNVIMAYCMFFLFSGFTATLPWIDCSNNYNTLNCYSLKNERNCVNVTDVTTTFWNKTCTPVRDFCQFYNLTFEPGNYSHCFEFGGNRAVPLMDVTVRTSASEDFWNARVLGMDVLGDHVSSRWDSWGGPRWELIGCLALCWTLVCLSLIKGAQSYGKVVYFTTLFPYVVLTVLLAYTSTLDGFVDGIRYYISPNWEKLADFEVWNAAAGQIFFSLGVAMGSHTIMSSYNDFRTNCHRDSLLIGFCNSATSIYAGFLVFGTVGFLAKKSGKAIEDVLLGGPGLAFVVYPEAVAAMEWSPPFFSFCFFLMLILLAISSTCGNWETVIGSLIDQFPVLQKSRTLTTVATCFFAFLAGVPMCFDSGFMLFQMVDSRSSKALLIMGFIELAILSWFYGTDRCFSHVSEMGMKLPKVMKVFWNVSWNFTTPLLIFAIIVLSWSNLEKDRFLDYVYPPWVQFIGWMVELAPILVGLLISTIVIAKNKKDGKGIAFVKPGRIMKPKPSWGRRKDAAEEDLGMDNVTLGVDNKSYQEESHRF